MAVNDIYTRVFVFSQEQMNEQKRTEEKLGKRYTPKQVIVNGSPRIYTDILLDKTSIRYTDTRIVVVGDIRSLKYTR